jgi:hypothetical protein
MVRNERNTAKHTRKCALFLFLFGIRIGTQDGEPGSLLVVVRCRQVLSFFLSLVWKTQANRWTKRMWNTQLTTSSHGLSFFLSWWSTGQTADDLPNKNCAVRGHQIGLIPPNFEIIPCRGTRYFHPTMMVGWKWNPQVDWVIKQVPHDLVRRIRFWSIKSPEHDFKYLYWTINKTLFWNLFTCKGT